MAANMPPNVWSQMGYVPPRGQCNFKQSIMSAKCPCLRFMLHPLKSASSYECDGCNHHASFHSMENRVEDEIRKRWEQEAKEKQVSAREDSAVERPRKRLRAIEGASSAMSSNARMLESGILSPDQSLNIQIRSLGEAGPSKTRAKPKRAGGRLVSTRTAATRAKGKVTEILDEEEDEVVQLD